MPGRKGTLEEVGKGWREHPRSFGKFGEVRYAYTSGGAWRLSLGECGLGSRSRPGTPRHRRVSVLSTITGNGKFGSG